VNAQDKQIQATCYVASGALLAVCMWPDGPLGLAGERLASGVTRTLGVAAWVVPPWLWDEAYNVLRSHSGLFRRARWVAGAWLAAISCELLGVDGGAVGHVGSTMHIAVGVLAYVIIALGWVALARSITPTTVDEVLDNLASAGSRMTRVFAGAVTRELAATYQHQARAVKAFAAERQALRLAANAGARPVARTRPAPIPRRPAPLQTGYRVPEIIDVPCEVVDTPSVATFVKRGLTYHVPSIAVLSPARPAAQPDAAELQRTAAKIWRTLGDHSIELMRARKRPAVGPVVVTHSVELMPGTKMSKMASISAEIGAELGRNVRVDGSTVEVPRADRQTVALRELLEQHQRVGNTDILPVVLGVSTTGESVSLDLAKAPHVLVAGETGSGKSVSINVMLVSLLLSQSPDELRLLLIDPKRVELSAYRDVPHMLAPVATETSDAVEVLRLACAEMERRYAALEQARARDISALGLPRIVLVVDEFADLVAQAPEAMPLTQRLVQKARAAGIHCILATQHPVKKVIDTVIKANVPTRVCCRVGSEVASRLVLGEECSDATSLLGNGDSLVILPTNPKPVRVHGAFVSDSDVVALCDAWRSQGAPQYVETSHSPTHPPRETGPSGGLNSAQNGQVSGWVGESSQVGESSDEALYERACDICAAAGYASKELLRRSLKSPTGAKLGYERAVKLIERMVREHLLGEPGARGTRPWLGDNAAAE